MERFLWNMREEASDVPLKDMQLGSLLGILNADDEETMWDSASSGPPGGRDLVDVEMAITDFKVRLSKNNEIDSPFMSEAGESMYLLVTAVRLADGQEIVWNTSAPDLVMRLFWARDHGKLPGHWECVIRGTNIGAGQVVLKLRPLPRRRIVDGTTVPPAADNRRADDEPAPY